MQDLQEQRTIRDFGEQWVAFPENNGYYASAELLEDICSPLLSRDDVQGRRVSDIGSGTGRIVNMLLDLGAAHVLAIEPSDAFTVLQRNIASRSEQVSLLRATGKHIPPTGDLDLVFSIGVLHHIPRPEPVVRAAYKALRPGGQLVVWLYGREGNEFYLFVVQPLRAITRRLPHYFLNAMVRLIDIPLVPYMTLCRVCPLPLRGYLRGVLSRFGPAERRLVIYDQLNPAFAKYYRRDEAVGLLEQNGFHEVRIHHRHGYSWTVVGRKPTR